MALAPFNAHHALPLLHPSTVAPIFNHGDEALIRVPRTLSALPGLRKELQDYGDISVDSIVQRTPIARHNPIVKDIMIATWDRIIDDLSRRGRQCGAGGSYVVSIMHELLETTHREDRQHERTYGVVNRPFEAPYVRTLALFIAMAEISRFGRSVGIARVLSHFFLRYGADVMMSDPGTIPEWGVAVRRSYMECEDKLQCLLEVLHCLGPYGPTQLPPSSNQIQYSQREVQSCMRNLKMLSMEGLEIESEYELAGRAHMDGRRAGRLGSRIRPGMHRHRSAPTTSRLLDYAPQYAVAVRDDFTGPLSAREGFQEMRARLQNIEDNQEDFVLRMSEMKDMLRHGAIPDMPGFF